MRDRRRLLLLVLVTFAAAIAGVVRSYLKLNLEPEFSFMHSRLIGTVLKPCQAVRVLALRGGAWHGLQVKHTPTFRDVLG